MGLMVEQSGDVLKLKGVVPVDSGMNWNALVITTKLGMTFKKTIILQT